MTVLPGDGPGIRRAAGHLLDGGVLGMPTETVYGLAAVAWWPEAVAKVFAAKERPLFDPLIAHVTGLEQAERLWDLGATAPAVRVSAVRLAEALWPGPLTLVLPRRAGVPDLVTAGLPSVAVRAPDHPVAQALIREVGEPLVAPSANRFGRISPTTARDVVQELGDRVPFVLDGGPCRIGVESTILGFDPSGRPRLLRSGGVPVERLRELLGVEPSTAGGATVEAPGQLASHYAPAGPLVLSDRLAGDVGRHAVLLATGPTDRVRAQGPVLVLSPSGDPSEAARRLFAALRALDASGLPLLAERWPDDAGLGHAINDRLRRASAPRA